MDIKNFINTLDMSGFMSSRILAESDKGKLPQGHIPGVSNYTGWCAWIAEKLGFASSIKVGDKVYTIGYESALNYVKRHPEEFTPAFKELNGKQAVAMVLKKIAEKEGKKPEPTHVHLEPTQARDMANKLHLSTPPTDNTTANELNAQLQKAPNSVVSEITGQATAKPSWQPQQDKPERTVSMPSQSAQAAQQPQRTLSGPSAFQGAGAPRPAAAAAPAGSATSSAATCRQLQFKGVDIKARSEELRTAFKDKAEAALANNDKEACRVLVAKVVGTSENDTVANKANVRLWLGASFKTNDDKKLFSQLVNAIRQ